MSESRMELDVAILGERLWWYLLRQASREICEAKRLFGCIAMEDLVLEGE